jgi:chromosome segregation ATPase
MLKMNKMKWRCVACKGGTSPPKMPAPPTLEEVFRLLGSLQGEIADMRKSIEGMFEKYNHQIADLKTSVNQFSDRLNIIDEEGAKTTSRMNDLQSENKRLKMGINRIEQSLLETSIEVRGLKFASESEMQPAVQSLLTGMDCADVTGDIVEVTRGFNMKKEEITVKFATRMARDKVLLNRKKVAEVNAKDGGCQGVKIYINEKLTAHNKHLLWLTKSTKPLGYKYVWSKNGLIHLKKEEGAKVIIIRDICDIPCR